MPLLTQNKLSAKNKRAQQTGFAQPVWIRPGGRANPNLDRLRQLYEMHSRAVYGYLRHMSGSDDAAFDVMQDVFVEAGRQMKKKPDVELNKAWLFRVARNKFLNSLRRSKRQVDFEVELLPQSVNSTGTDHEAGIEWDHLKSRIVRTLYTEKEEFASIFLLRMDEDMRKQEIAQTLGISERTLRRYLNRIRDIILKNFERELPFAPVALEAEE